MVSRRGAQVLQERVGKMSAAPVVTIMNYPEGSIEEAMCKGWLYLIRRSNPGVPVVVFHERPTPELRAFAPWARFERLSAEGVLNRSSAVGRVCEGMEYKLALWKSVGDVVRGPFVFLDADAWVLGPIDTLIEIAPTKSFAALEEGVYSLGPAFGKTFGPPRKHMNSGVFTCSGDGLITYGALVDQYARDGGINWLTGDQGILNAYFDRIGYDWSHPSLDFTWNCMAWTAMTIRADDEKIEVVSGDRPNPKPVMSPNWSWFGRRSLVNILHAFWKKFWELPEMGYLWDYVMRKIGETRFRSETWDPAGFKVEDPPKLI